MATDHIQPMPGRRPVYPIDADEEGQSGGKKQKPGKAPTVASEGSADDPASDANTDSANHPNDE